MRVAMVGCGAAGSVFASFLRMGGCDLTVVDINKTHMDAVAANGMDCLVAPSTPYHVDGFKTAYDCNDIGIMDAIIFVTKATFLTSGLETAKPAIGPNTVLVSLINGVGNEDYLIDVVGEDRVIYGSGTLGTFLNAPGKCTCSPPGAGLWMNFGAVKRNDLTNAVGEHLEKCFNDGHCPAKYWDDVAPAVWHKANSNCTYNALTTLLRLKCKYIMKSEFGCRCIEMVSSEVYDVAAARGVNMSKEEFMNEARIGADAPISNYYTSMAQDLLFNERRTEIETLNGRIVEMGKKYGVPTPVNEFIYNAISCMQDHIDVMYPKEK